MTYIIGDTLFEGSGTGDSGLTKPTVSERLTVRVFFGASLIAASVQKGTSLKVALFLNDKKIAESSSNNPGLSLSGNTSVAMEPNKEYVFKAVQENKSATADSTWVRGVIVIV